MNKGSGKMAHPCIIGWAHSKFGKASEEGVEQLVAGVVPDALDCAGISAQDIDGIFVGVYNNGFSRQGFEGSLVAMGMPALMHVPATRLENACATGSAAIYGALDFLAAGRGRIALVVGAEKMTGTPNSEVSDILLSAAYRTEEGDTEGGFAGVFGRIASSYFQKHGDHSRELAMISANNHANGMRIPWAHIQKIWASASATRPATRTRSSRDRCGVPIAHLFPMGRQRLFWPRRISPPPCRAHNQVNDILALSRRDPTEFAGARGAWQASLAEAGVTLDDLDMVETHDCFTIAELLEYEAMGLAPRGQGGRVIREGLTTREGRLPVNPSGGLKTRGHPLGATGVSQHVMAAMQLADDAGTMQLPNVDLAGVFNMGGAAVANYVSILERTK